MTIICAIHEPGVGTWVGADRRTTFGAEIWDHTDKFIRKRGTIILHAGCQRALHLMRARENHFLAAKSPYELSDMIRAAIKEDEWNATAEEGEPPTYESGAILATAAGAWLIACDLSVVPAPAGVMLADGSGHTVATGAAFVAKKLGLTPKQIIEHAVAAACALDRGCGGPPFIELIG